MPFTPSRLVALRLAKGWERKDLAERANVSASQVTKHENGDVSSDEIVEKLADALDSTLDFLYSRGEQFDSADDAAMRMSLDCFSRDSNCNDQRLEWCRRVLQHSKAPRTKAGWVALVEQIELAVRPSGNGHSLRVVGGG